MAFSAPFRGSPFSALRGGAFYFSERRHSVTGYLKRMLSVLFDALVGVEDSMERGLKVLNKAFVEWEAATRNPIHKAAVFFLHLAFLAFSFVVGSAVLVTAAGLPIILIFELVRWLTSK